jgi:hypothetical protein
VSGLTFRTSERQAEPGYIATIDHLCYTLRDDGRDQYGPLDALYVYPPGRPDLALRACNGNVAMRNLDKLHQGELSIERLLEVHETPVPWWIAGR